MGSNQNLRKTLSNHLMGGQAYMTVGDMLKEISFDQLSVRPKDLPYSFYELFYHMHFTQ